MTTLSRGASGLRLIAVLLVVGGAVAAGLAQVRASDLAKEYRRGEVEVLKALPELVILEKESRAERGLPASVDEVGFHPAPGSAYRYSATIAVIPTRRKIDVVLRAVRQGDAPLQGDAWETDCDNKLVHVVDRSREATMGGVLRSWLRRPPSPSPVIGLATPEAAAADRKKREPSTAEARRDQVRWIEFHSWDVENGCCRAIGKEADLCCLTPLRILVDLQNRPYRIHAGAAEAFPDCPAALALALSDDPQSLVEPVAVAARAFGSADPVRRAAGARLFGHLRDAVWSDPASGFAALSPALGQPDMALFGPAATAVATVEDRARTLAGGCRLADCSAELEGRQRDEARPTLKEVEALGPSVRETAQKLLRPLVACAADPACGDRVGAAWALGQADRPGRLAASALVSCLAASEGPLRGVSTRSLVRMGAADDSVVDVVREAARRARTEDEGDSLLAVLVRYRATRDEACGTLARRAVEHIESVRNPAAAVLGRAGRACGDVAISFAPFLKSASSFPRQESIRLLGLLGPSNKPYLLDALAAPDLSDFSRRDVERALARADQPDEP